MSETGGPIYNYCPRLAPAMSPESRHERIQPITASLFFLPFGLATEIVRHLVM